jgi:exonuclease SbcD
VLYAGSLERVDFGDERQEKGFYLIEIDDRGARPRDITYRFIPLEARRFFTLEVDAARGEPMERALRAIAEAQEAGQIGDAVVRLRLHVRPEDAGLVDVPALRRALEAAFFVAAVTVDVGQAERVAVRAPLDRLEPLEALERYWIARGTSAKRRATLMQHTQELMSLET